MAKSLICNVAFPNATSKKSRMQLGAAKSLICNVAFGTQVVARNLPQLAAVAVPCIGGTQRNLRDATYRNTEGAKE